MREPKNRSDLNFVEGPKAIEFDYSKDVTNKKIESMDRAMMLRSGLTGVELHQKLEAGILVSGEDW